MTFITSIISDYVINAIFIFDWIIKMRLDKFLKVSRIIKRRVIAKEASDSGKISVNGKIAKASTKISVGDIVSITFSGNERRYKVLSLDDKAKKDNAGDLYEIL